MFHSGVFTDGASQAGALAPSKVYRQGEMDGGAFLKSPEAV
jgi:hypothetical protein